MEKVKEKAFKFEHWLKIKESESELEELEQYRVIERYLEKRNSRASVYMVGEELFDRVILLESNDEYEEIKVCIASSDYSPDILEDTPNDVNYLGSFEFAPFGDIEGWIIR